MRVLVVGAGPAGAVLALLLARAGAQVTLLERQTDFAREFRGEGLMPSGRDVLLQMGLGPQLDALPHSTVEQAELFAGERRLFTVQLGAGGLLPIFVPQPAMLEMLVHEGAALDGFEFVRGATVRDLLRDGERVVGVRADTPDGPREIAADFVIATDGRASVVRRRLGRELPSDAEQFDVVWFKVPRPKFMDDVVRFYLARGHFCICLPSPDDQLQVGWVIEKSEFGELRRRGVEEWVGELADCVSPDLGVHLRSHVSEITHPFLLDVVCDHLVSWTAPGALLIGDAAHPMSPVGAQGINIALRDAAVTANHLARPLADGATPEALDAAALAIQDERLPEIREIQRLQRLPPRVLFQRTAASRFFVRRVLPLLVRTGVAGRFVGGLAQRFTQGVGRVELAK